LGLHFAPQTGIEDPLRAVRRATRPAFIEGNPIQARFGNLQSEQTISVAGASGETA
jgi:hypothetical protein